MQENIKIEYVDLTALNPAEYNPRQASEKEYNDLKSSMTRFGLVDPIIVNNAPNRMNTVIGGHFRLRIAKDVGLVKVPVVYVTIEDEAKERELNLRLNRNSGSWNFDLLANFDEGILREVGFTDFDFGFIPGESKSEEPGATTPKRYHWLFIRLTDKEQMKRIQSIFGNNAKSRELNPEKIMMVIEGCEKKEDLFDVKTG